MAGDAPLAAVAMLTARRFPGERSLGDPQRHAATIRGPLECRVGAAGTSPGFRIGRGSRHRRHPATIADSDKRERDRRRTMQKLAFGFLDLLPLERRVIA